MFFKYVWRSSSSSSTFFKGVLMSRYSALITVKTTEDSNYWSSIPISAATVGCPLSIQNDLSKSGYLRGLCGLESFDNVFLVKKRMRTKILELKILWIHTKGVYYSPNNFQHNLIIKKNLDFMIIYVNNSFCTLFETLGTEIQKSAPHFF